jgi:hypothetical protein
MRPSRPFAVSPFYPCDILKVNHHLMKIRPTTFPGDNLLAHVPNAHAGFALFLGGIKAVPVDYIRNQSSIDTVLSEMHNQ